MDIQEVVTGLKEIDDTGIISFLKQNARMMAYVMDRLDQLEANATVAIVGGEIESESSVSKEDIARICSGAEEQHIVTTFLKKDWRPVADVLKFHEEMDPDAVSETTIRRWIKSGKYQKLDKPGALKISTASVIRSFLE